MTAGAWKAFQLVPDDVLFFRDGKPSRLGSDHYLRSLFPPLPSTLYGAVRTRRLLDEGIDLAHLDERTWPARGPLHEELGAWGGFGSLELRGPWLVRDGEALVPAPWDLALITKEPADEGAAPHVLNVLRYQKPAEGQPNAWSHPLELLSPHEGTPAGWREWQSPPQPEPAASAGWFLRPEGLASWRRGEAPGTEQLVHSSEFWADELRTGLGLVEGKRLSAEHKLYTFGFIRLRHGVALGFEARGTELQTEGRLRLGGEGRTARLEAGPGFPDSAPTGKPGGSRFRLAFATPTLSASGAYPPGFAATSLEGPLAGRSCRLAAGICRAAMPAGGWDLAREQAKPLRRAIPAGATYVFEPNGSHTPGEPQSLHGTCIADDPEEQLSRQGFGLLLAAIDT